MAFKSNRLNFHSVMELRTIVLGKLICRDYCYLVYTTSSFWGISCRTDSPDFYSEVSEFDSWVIFYGIIFFILTAILHSLKSKIKEKFMNYLNLIFRTAILYLFLLFMLRLMGKRELGQLSPFDFVVAILIAELAAIPMEESSIPILHGIIPIATLVFLEILLSYLTLKNESIRRLINGSPSILIRNGRIQTRELKNSRCNINDLLGHLREKNIFDLTDVEFAILEPSGKLSVILKSQKRALRPEDIGISTDYEGLPTPLIIDGIVHHDHLASIHLDEEWLKQELTSKGIVSPKEVVFASISTDGELYVALKN